MSEVPETPETVQIDLPLSRILSRFSVEFGRAAAMPVHADVVERFYHDYFGNVYGNYLQGIWEDEARVVLTLRCCRMCGQRAAYLATKDESDAIYANHFADAAEEVRGRLVSAIPAFRGDIC